MPQASTPYAIARTKVLEGQLITGERLKRMVEAPDYESVKRALSEAGYDSADSDDYEGMIKRSMEQACSYVREVSPNALATDVFLLKHDCNNLKCLFKARLLGSALTDPLSTCGTLSVEQVQLAVQDGTVSYLPENMAAACKELATAMEAGTAQAQQIDLVLDNACFADMADFAKMSGNQLVIEAVQAQADLLNLRTLLRLRASGQQPETLANALVHRGRIEKKRFLDAYNVGDDALYAQLGLSRYQAVAEAGLEEYINSGSLSRLERLADDYITGLFRGHRHEIFSVAPLIGYLIAKERETQAVRLLLVGKLNDVPNELVMERLRELYEQ